LPGANFAATELGGGADSSSDARSSAARRNEMNNWVRVLIIDDSDDDAESTALALCRAGYTPIWQRVETAEAVEEAVTNRRWDVITCDLVTCGLDARAAMRIIRALAPRTPIIIVAEPGSEAHSAGLIEAGAFGVVSKRRLDVLGDLVANAIEDV